MSWFVTEISTVGKCALALMTQPVIMSLSPV